jgi:hypothetical protein
MVDTGNLKNELLNRLWSILAVNVLKQGVYQGLTITMTEHSTKVHTTQQLTTQLTTFRLGGKKYTLCLSHLQYELHLPVFISLHT